MEERLSHPGNSHNAVSGPTNGQSGCCLIDMSSTVLINGSVLADDILSHKDLPLKNIITGMGWSLGLQVVLSKSPSQRMRG